MSRPFRSLGHWHKVATLAVIASLLCAVPLYRALDLQGSVLDVLRRGETAVDPLRTATDVQRGLVEHRGLAREVLRRAVPPEDASDAARRARAAVLDGDIARLHQDLARLAHAPAAAEAAALAAGWVQLDGRVRERRIDATGSDAAHALLLEQNLQVMDWVLQAAATPDRALPLTAVLPPVPRTVADADDARALAALQSWSVRLAAADAGLREARARVERDRRSMALACAALALAAALVAASLARHARAPAGRTAPSSRSDAPPQPPAAAADIPPRPAAELLLRRLREPAPPPGDAPAGRPGTGDIAARNDDAVR
ncbi:MAG: hypothetical protein MUF03_03445 [Rubrivivax sp.]|jgi:hypothetical protein|nr:hypothetical protein [Rubrivivax sp.]